MLVIPHLTDLCAVLGQPQHAFCAGGCLSAEDALAAEDAPQSIWSG